jgi:drug/metabolite transporter (DMT)-like permease
MWAVAGLLCTGVGLNVISQLVSDAGFAHTSAHIVPWVKFASTLAAAAAARARAPPYATTTRQRRLMLLIGALDAAAYAAFCVGFAAVGAAAANVLLAGASQLATALASRFVLGRRLGRAQLAALALVLAGLALRAAPAPGGASALGAVDPAGAALVLGAGLLYAALGVAYEMLVRASAGAAPPHAVVLWSTARVGFVGATAFQLLHTLPRWEALVAAPARAAGATPASVLPLLLLFGAAFNVHMWVQSRVFKAEGALAVSLVTAARGAALTGVSAALFCSPAAPRHCATPRAVAAAAVTALGGAVWVLAGGGKLPGKPADTAAAAGAAAEEKKKEL